MTRPVPLVNYPRLHPVAAWLRCLPGSRLLPWRLRLIDQVGAADDVPDVLRAKTAVLVTSREQPSWLAFDCPRHPQERILLNLAHVRHPRWSLDSGTGDNRITLYPSVDAFHAGARCHFWLRSGRVHWVADEADRIGE